jgi:hypothetical protein
MGVGIDRGFHGWLRTWLFEPPLRVQTTFLLRRSGPNPHFAGDLLYACATNPSHFWAVDSL